MFEIFSRLSGMPFYIIRIKQTQVVMKNVVVSEIKKLLADFKIRSCFRN